MQIASIALPDGFAAMTDRKLTTYRGAETHSHIFDEPDACLAALRDLFRIKLNAEDEAALKRSWDRLA
jgi:arylamine N-acetyltransferase